MKVKRPAKKKRVDLTLGPLPVEFVNPSLGMDLEPGVTILSAIAQRHIQTKHPGDYALCMAHIATIIARPLYIGDDFRNPGNIELVGRVTAVDSHILVAVKIAPDEHGQYRVATFYRISAKKVQSRRQSGHLVIATTHKAPL